MQNLIQISHFSSLEKKSYDNIMTNFKTTRFTSEM